VSNTDLLSSDAASAPVADAAGTSETSQRGSNGGTTKRRAGLSGMVLAELRELAGQLGITGTAGMRKGDLIAAIKEKQSGGSAGGDAPKKSAENSSDTLPLGMDEQPSGRKSSARQRTSDGDDAAAANGKPEKNAAKADAPEQAEGDSEDGGRREGGRRRRGANRQAGSPDSGERSGGESREDKRDDKREDNRRDDRQGGNRQQNNDRGGRQNNNNDDDDDEGGRRRGRRFRDRRRRGGGGGGRGDNADTEIREDDVLLPVAGVLDVLENYAFVRTSGYLSGPNDVYVSLSLVRKYGLRRGDAITGMVRQPREGEQQRQKFNPLVRVETINGLDPEAAKKRPEFTKLTPLYPNERIRLETEPHLLTTRVIDLVMPVGKGQRALIVSPPKAGKTMVLQSIANAVTTNNPECYLMVVLIDERPEEVTDMQRSVKGEVIASTFDRPPSDHTTVAELSIERAKRLVEMGHDVVVLLDSITRLGRAYNLAAPASGRILSGGVDSTALFPPKRFLGAARNIEDGGSLTIFATALVETGSAGDTVIFEEFKGTGNAELKLDRKIADKRIFPAVDVDASSTRKEELLLSPDELAVTVKLRRVLHALDTQQAIDLLLTQLRKTRTNIEFLMQVAKNTPSVNDD
jgi:transcription termination factor Rho